MKLFCAWAQVALLSLLAMLSCAGDGVPQLGAVRQASKEEAPPEQPDELALPETPIVAGADAGYLPGSGQVTPDGAYIYQLPIDVPPGRGIEPRLAITYSSRAGDGLLGVGFSLSGLSSILRCHKTITVDGVVDGIDNDGTDVFCLDGQRLVSVLGAYGADGTEYRTEEESFTRVISYGSPQPERFRAWLKDGRIRDYDRVGPLDFRITKEQDRYGNTVSYIYAEFAGDGAKEVETEHLIDRIEYLGHRIAFGYASGRYGRATLYTGGVPRMRNRVLRWIAVHGPNPSDQGLLWRYDLDYEQGPEDSADTARARLVEVKRCGGLGGCFLARQFRWSSRYGDWFKEVPLDEHPWFTGAEHPLVLDVDGDGKDEVLLETTDPAAPYLLLHTPPSSEPLRAKVALAGETGSSPAFDGARLKQAKAVDAGGDGRSELFTWNDRAEQFEMYAWTGSGFAPTGTAVPMSPDLGPFAAGLEPFHFADVDGDGLADLVKLLDNAVDGIYEPEFLVRRNLPSGDFGSADETGIPVVSTDALEFASVALDVQGDGRAGLWQKGASQAYYPDDAGGFSTVEIPVERAYPVVDAHMADLNGDGLRDLVEVALLEGNSIYLGLAWNTGKRFVRERGYSGLGVARHPGTLQMADVDADGRDDFIVVGDDPPGIEITRLLAVPKRRWDHGWWTRTVASPSARITAVRHGDFNGDGLLDLMYLTERCSSTTEGPASACTSGTKVGSLRVLVQQSTVIDVVDEVLDEGGALREEIEYARQWTDTPGPAPCAYPQVCHRRGIPVVTKHLAHEGMGALRWRYFSYEDPRSDVLGRGFLGFGKVRVWEPKVPRETVTTFDHGTRIGTRYPFAGRPATVTVATPVLENDSDGPTDKPSRAAARVERRTMHYEARELNGGATHAVFPQDWISKEWEEEVAIDWGPEGGVHITEIDGPAQAALRTRFGSTRFDDWGSLERETTETVGGTRTVVERAYEHRLEPWLLSLPAWEKVTSTTAGGTDSTVRRARFEFTDAGRIERVVVEPLELSEPDPAVTATVHYEYDAEGLLRCVTQTALGVPARRVHIGYDGTPGHTAPSVIWNDLGHAQWFAVHAGHGVVMAEMDANGVQTRRVHDDLGRLVSRRSNGAGEQTLSYEQRWDGVTVRTSDGGGASGFVELDVSGRPWHVGHVGHDGATLTSETRYDAFGRVIAQSRPARQLDEAPRTEQVYDSLGRLLRVVGPDGATTRYTHSFFETTASDPRGSRTKLVRDLDGRVAQSISYLGRTRLSTEPDRFDDHLSVALATRYEYGPFDQIERIIDPDGNVTSIDYDVRGRRTRLVDPDRGTTRFYRNGLGDLYRKVEGGEETSYEHDVIGRVDRVTDGDGVTEYTWDTAAHGMGRLAATASPDGTTTGYDYDKHGRLESLTWRVGGEPFQVRTTYDAQGRVELVAYPEVPHAPRFTVKHTYDSRGYLEGIADVTADPASAGAPLWTVNARNEDGALSEATYGNGVVLTRSYDPVTGRLESVAQRINGIALSSLRYAYYSDGRVKHRFEPEGDRSESYVYDTLHRLRVWTLKSGGEGRGTRYDYDRLGNLTQVTVDGEEREKNEYLDARPHAVSSNLDGSFFYDARGRLEQDPEREIRYTSFDLPREITTAAGVTRFDYDAAGARVRKAGPAGTTVTLGGLYERRQGAEGTKHVFLVPGSDGLMVAQVVVDERSGERRVQYLHQDAQGSVTLVTEADGSAAESAYAYYEPFGRRIERDGAPLGGVMAELRLGLTGHEHDDELGLINLKGRIYDPRLKRVLTPDPVVSAPLFGQSYNRYSYVLNDPMNLVDPTGYEPTGPDCTTCAPWTPPQPPWGEGGGGGTIISGGSGDGDDGNPYTSASRSEGSSELNPPGPVVKSDVDGFQGAGAGAHQGSLLVQLLNERARQDRLYYEALQRDTFRVTQWAMLGAGAALLVWSGGYALLAIEELSVFGGAVGMTSTQVAAANAASFTMKAVPAILGEVWVMEGLSQNDPGRIADGLMIAASAGASFGEGLGSGPRAGSPRIYLNRHGQITNGRYVVDSKAMMPHQTGSLRSGKSQWLSTVDAEKAVLDAASKADELGLWQGSKAKVPADVEVGALGRTGELTRWINVYRTKTGFVHGAPGSPL
ncbi:RHS repeat-associated core domain-containing protein [Sorangium sp. So ce260]|uniref:RHS repeat-associated core domain-containing protein n=1 Tax=Sorangium sp. So ce260 TaxID=3133291 RepID=UPI003F62694B